MMLGTRDVILKPEQPATLLLDLHTKYLTDYAKDKNGTEQMMSEYLRMSGMYWGLNALYLMDKLPKDDADINEIIDFIHDSQHIEGGFSAAVNHDPHILHTLSAIQILILYERCDSKVFDIDKCVAYIKSLQQADGCFFGDKWGEIDTRFTFCALASLKLLGRLDAINLDKAVEFIMRCHNQIDGGFGSKPGSESHAAYVYCCVGALAIAQRLHLIDANQLGWWLAERQMPSGGLNGRPEKLPDLCYSWWCLASMKIIDRFHWINQNKLFRFMLACQDEEQGGFSDRPGNWPDPYHTLFGLAGISLMANDDKQCTLKKEKIGEQTNSDQVSDVDSTSSKQAGDNKIDKFFQDKFNELKRTHVLKLVDPIFCMPAERLNLK